MQSLSNIFLRGVGTQNSRREIALMSNWEEKVEAVARATAEEVCEFWRVSRVGPLVCQRVLDIRGSSNLREVANLWLYMHGGVGFEPYGATFESLIPDRPGCPPMHYLETYNASEGFFSYQDYLSSVVIAL